MAEYETVVRAYRGLADALNSEEDRESLSDLVATIVEQIIWRPAPDPSGKHRYSGGSYDYVLFDNPLLSHELQKARRLEEDDSSLEGQDWLPGDNLLRNISEQWLEDEATLYGVYDRRKLKLSFDPPPLRERRLGTHRRWVRNPIHVALELKAEMDQRPGLSQEALADERGVTRTRICQYLRLLDLPEDVVEFIADERNDEVTATVTESALRELLRIEEPVEVRRRFYEIVVRQEALTVGAIS